MTSTEMFLSLSFLRRIANDKKDRLFTKRTRVGYYFRLYISNDQDSQAMELYITNILNDMYPNNKIAITSYSSPKFDIDRTVIHVHLPFSVLAHIRNNKNEFRTFLRKEGLIAELIK